MMHRNGNEILGKKNTTAMRGIAIIMVILHHYSQYYSTPGYFHQILDQFGYLAVGLFFVLSGYGNKISFQKRQFNKKNSLLWLLKRIFHIYVTFWVILIIAYPLMQYICGIEWKPEIVLQNCITLTLPTWTNWYLKIQVMLYIIFVLTECLFHKVKYSSAIITVLLLCYIVCVRHMGFMNFWWNTVLCYPLGIFMAEIKDDFSTKNFMKIQFIGSILVFIVATYLKQWNNLWGIIASLCFCVIVLYFNTMYTIGGKILAWTGKRSLEIYMTHLIVIRILLSLKVQELPAFVLIFVLAFVYAIVVHKIVDMILSKGINIWESRKK